MIVETVPDVQNNPSKSKWCMKTRKPMILNDLNIISSIRIDLGK